MPWVVCNLFALLGLRFYLGIREVWSAPTAVRMHIMCMHMAMAVSRIALSCIRCLYLSDADSVKRRVNCASFMFSSRLPMYRQESVP